MTWTYSGDPASSSRDAVRFWIGDTDTDDQLLNDEELDFLLAAADDNIGAAAMNAVRGLIGKFARMVDRSHGDLSVRASQRAAQYRDLLKTLSARFDTAAAYVSVNGVASTYETDNDKFWIGMHDKP